MGFYFFKDKRPNWQNSEEARSSSPCVVLDLLWVLIFRKMDLLWASEGCTVSVPPWDPPKFSREKRGSGFSFLLGGGQEKLLGSSSEWRWQALDRSAGVSVSPSSQVPSPVSILFVRLFDQQPKLCPGVVALTSGSRKPALETEGRVMLPPVCCYCSWHLQLTSHFGFKWTQQKMFSVVKAQSRLLHLQLPCYFKNGCFWILFFSLYLDYFSPTCLSTIQSPLGDSVDYTRKTSAVRFQLGLCCSGQIWGLEEVREGRDLQFTVELDPGNWGRLPHPHPGNLHSNHCRHIEAVRGCGLRQEGVGPSGRCAWLRSVTSVVSNSCDPMDGSPPDSSVPGILQAGRLEWVAMPSSRGSSRPRDRTHISYVSCIGRRVLYHECHLGSPQLP